MRPSRDETFLRIAEVIAERTTCGRRAVGCVLVDRNGRVLAMGHNGVAKDQPHCNEGYLCPGVGLPSGTGLDHCYAIHAEQNALMFCRNVDEIDTCYVTSSPCMHCMKMLLNTGCRRVVFRDLYSLEAEEAWVAAKDFDLETWACLPKETPGKVVDEDDIPF